MAQIFPDALSAVIRESKQHAETFVNKRVAFEASEIAQKPGHKKIVFKESLDASGHWRPLRSGLCTALHVARYRIRKLLWEPNEQRTAAPKKQPDTSANSPICPPLDSLSHPASR